VLKILPLWGLERFFGFWLPKCRPTGTIVLFYLFSLFLLEALSKKRELVAKVLELQTKNRSTFLFLIFISYSLFFIPYFLYYYCRKKSVVIQPIRVIALHQVTQLFHSLFLIFSFLTSCQNAAPLGLL
jgi:hypothetical protein